MTNGLDKPIYDPILQQIEKIPYVNIIEHGMADNKGYDIGWAEIIVGFDTRLKHGWRGWLLRKTETIANLEDIEGYIQHTCGYEPDNANDRRLFYKIKERIDGGEKLYLLEISPAAFLI